MDLYSPQTNEHGLLWIQLDYWEDGVERFEQWVAAFLNSNSGEIIDRPFSPYDYRLNIQIRGQELALVWDVAFGTFLIAITKKAESVLLEIAHREVEKH